MPHHIEGQMPMQDAPASMDTQYRFEPHPDGSYNAVNNTFQGSLSSNRDVDWIKIELQAGKEYTITVNARPTADDETTTEVDESDTGLVDSILTVYDDKGGMVDQNDDEDGSMGKLNSVLKVTPDADAVFFIAVSANMTNPGVMYDGDYTVMVTERVVGPADINGGPNDDKLDGTAGGEKIAGNAGNDILNGMGGDDELSGGAGNDLLIGGMGGDTLSGGPDMDTISYAYSEMGVTVNLTTGSARGGDAEGDTIVSNRAEDDHIENVQGSMHDDSITGNRGANKLWGLGGNDELNGEDGMDTLFGGAGDDDLDGGDDDDTLQGGYGADMLTGGDSSPVDIDDAGDEYGGDTASYSMSMMGVTVRLHSGQAMGGDAEGDTWNLAAAATYVNSDEDEVEVNLADIENLTGSANDDILAGDFRDNVIQGGDGNDKIYGGPNPTDAHEMDSTITNADRLHGDDGNDMIFGGYGGDILRGGAGDDMLNGGAGADQIYGGTGSDFIYADKMDTLIIGDVMQDDAGTADVDESGAMMGDVDTVSFEKLEDEGIGADGAAWTLDTASSNAYGIENVIGTQADDYITGNAGNNVIEGGEGGDDMDGAGGEDTLSYASSDDWVRVTLNGQGDTSPATTSRGHASGDSATNFENVRGSAHDDDITGDTGDNKLWGGAGDDEIVGGDGADTVEGGAGEDELDGDHGNREAVESGPTATQQVRNTADVLSYASSNAAVTVNLTTSKASGGHAEGDTIATFEVEIPAEEEGDDPTEIDVSTFERVTGSMHDDSLTGDHRMNVLNGMGGDDNIRGLDGWDMLIGGPGADRLDGGESGAMEDDPATTGDNEATAEDVDWAVYRHAEGDVTVDLSTRTGTGGDAMGDQLIGIEVVWGSDNNEEGEGDTFIASSGADMIHGDLGSDTVSYEASRMGVRVTLSDTHDDAAFIATGTDPEVGDPTAGLVTTATPTAGVGTPGDVHLATAVPYRVDDADVVYIGATEAQMENNTNGAAGDRLGGIENLTGSAQDDLLTGNDNDNTLKGGDGDDILNSGTGGDDTLMGGDGDDELTAVDGTNMLHGGAGDDTITGGSGDDTINGGAGDDQLTDNAGGTDTFVFSPADGDGDDVITGFTVGTDRIDLTAYALTADQIAASIDVFGGNVRIDLTQHGGGKILLSGVTDIETLDEADTTTDPVNVAGSIQILNVFDADTNDDGVFII